MRWQREFWKTLRGRDRTTLSYIILNLSVLRSCLCWMLHGIFALKMGYTYPTACHKMRLRETMEEYGDGWPWRNPRSLYWVSSLNVLKCLKETMIRITNRSKEVHLDFQVESGIWERNMLSGMAQTPSSPVHTDLNIYYLNRNLSVKMVLYGLMLWVRRPVDQSQAVQNLTTTECLLKVTFSRDLYERRHTR